jgi:hypothetical protein
MPTKEGIADMHKRLDVVRTVFPDALWDTNDEGDIVILTHENYSDLIEGGLDTNATDPVRLEVGPDGQPVVNL